MAGRDGGGPPIITAECHVLEGAAISEHAAFPEAAH